MLIDAVFQAALVNRYVRELDRGTPGPARIARQVLDGHYVDAEPTPLPDPYLVACSPDVMRLVVGSDVPCDPAFFSGHANLTYWSTPYALSIYGAEQVPDGAGPRGDGYGDGRVAIMGQTQDWEVQMKGSGPTAFRRHGDGRAVLRSSTREFLASEAMFHLGVPTTRALSLVASETCFVRRPWYTANTSSEYKHGGDHLRLERCAITTRVSRDFLRVGHFELYARRARDVTLPEYRRQTALVQLKKLVAYASNDIPHYVAQCARAQAELAAQWLRVGYAQSNFNSDNCLVSGVTVDYGPFGFVERYRPDYVMWIGGGRHFSFQNQPEAARRNFETFRSSIRFACDDDACRSSVDNVPFDLSVVDDMWAAKIGFATPTRHVARLLSLMSNFDVDYTILFRQLAHVVDRRDLGPLAIAFYDDLPEFRWRPAWEPWVAAWLADNPDSDLMRRTNPKYVPREWMLQDAYEAAQAGDNSLVHRLLLLFSSPYDEHADLEDRYYRKAPSGAESQGGLGFMS